MDGTAKSPSLSPEAAAFRRYYNDLLYRLNRCPVKLADFLFSDGIISREEKDSIAASTDDEQGRLLLDTLQQAIVQTSKASATMRSLRRAFETVSLDTFNIKMMEDFVDG